MEIKKALTFSGCTQPPRLKKRTLQMIRFEGFFISIVLCPENALDLSRYTSLQFAPELRSQSVLIKKAWHHNLKYFLHLVFVLPLLFIIVVLIHSKVRVVVNQGQQHQGNNGHQ